MEAPLVPDGLRRRLGEDAAFDLLNMFQSAELGWGDQILARATERFGRMLAEEGGRLRQEIATSRVELLKWSFLFWVGQVAAVAGLLAFMLRAGGR